jgi:hypothetical protein
MKKREATIQSKTKKTLQPVTVKVEDGKLILQLPLTRPFRSRSGKTMVVASTSGSLPTDAIYWKKHLVVSANAFFYTGQQDYRQRAMASMKRAEGKLK